jgi:hypothetical protein
MESRVEHTNTFRARSDDGREFTIYEFTNVFETQSDKGMSRVEGTKSLKLEDGTSVRRLGKGKYEVVDPFHGNTTVTSDDKNAP